MFQQWENGAREERLGGAGKGASIPQQQNKGKGKVMVVVVDEDDDKGRIGRDTIQIKNLKFLCYLILGVRILLLRLELLNC